MLKFFKARARYGAAYPKILMQFVVIFSTELVSMQRKKFCLYNHVPQYNSAVYRSVVWVYILSEFTIIIIVPILIIIFISSGRNKRFRTFFSCSRIANADNMLSERENSNTVKDVEKVDWNVGAERERESTAVVRALLHTRENFRENRIIKINTIILHTRSCHFTLFSALVAYTR